MLKFGQYEASNSWKKIQNTNWKKCDNLLIFWVFYCVSTIIFSENLSLFKYLIDKKFRRQKIFVGNKWRNFWQVTRYFADEFSSDEISTDNFFYLGEAKLICCFTGQATQKVGSIGRQKNKNKGEISSENYAKMAANLINSDEQAQWKI